MHYEASRMQQFKERVRTRNNKLTLFYNEKLICKNITDYMLNKRHLIPLKDLFLFYLCKHAKTVVLKFNDKERK